VDLPAAYRGPVGFSLAPAGFSLDPYTGLWIALQSPTHAAAKLDIIRDPGEKSGLA